MNSLNANRNIEQALIACVVLPASKSESNRVLLIRALSGYDFPINMLSEAEDTVLMHRLLKKIKQQRELSIPVKIDVNKAGTVMRFLTALLAVTQGQWILSGDKVMNKRPIGILAESLKKLGADVRYHEKGTGFPPLYITGRTLEGGELDIDAGTSSQFISALMLVAPSFKDGLILHLTNGIVSHPYIALTAHVMERFGAAVVIDDRDIYISHSIYGPAEYTIEADWSAASYWYEMAAFSKKAEIKLMNLYENSYQGDSILSEIFIKFGIQTEYHDGYILLRKVSQTVISSFDYDFTACPDLAQTLAVTCAGLGIKARLAGLKTLKIKETDRLNALYIELNKAGYPSKIEDDTTLIIEPAENIHANPCRVKTYRDHRMAMAFAPLAMLRKNVIINEPEVVVKSYPGFWDDLKLAAFILDKG